MAKAPHVIASNTTTSDGFSFLFFAKGNGKRRRVWWACGACWDYGTPTGSDNRLRRGYQAHMLTCLGRPYAPASLTLSIQPAQAPLPVSASA